MRDSTGHELTQIFKWSVIAIFVILFLQLFGEGIDYTNKASDKWRSACVKDTRNAYFCYTSH